MKTVTLHYALRGTVVIAIPDGKPLTVESIKQAVENFLIGATDMQLMAGIPKNPRSIVPTSTIDEKSITVEKVVDPETETVFSADALRL